MAKQGKYRKRPSAARGFLVVDGEEQEAKECVKCGKMKPLSDFHREKSNSDGRRGDCKACNTQRVGSSRKVHRRYFSAYEKSRRQEDREAYNLNHRGWAKRRRAEDAAVAASHNLRAPLRRALVAIKEGKSDFHHQWRDSLRLGYSLAQLKVTVESRMKPGMTWHNHGEWHVDHKIPILHFVRKGVTSVRVIHALCNLQPLWAEENWAKGDKHPITGEVA